VKNKIFGKLQFVKKLHEVQFKKFSVLLSRDK